MHQITMPINWLITLYYWILIKTEPGNDEPFFRDYASHLHPILALVLDYSMVHAPYKLRHYLFVFIYSLIYAFLINMPMALAGTPAYTLLTWKSPGSLVLVAGLFIFVILTHMVFVGLSYCCKARLFNR